MKKQHNKQCHTTIDITGEYIKSEVISHSFVLHGDFLHCSKCPLILKAYK